MRSIAIKKLDVCISLWALIILLSSFSAFAVTSTPLPITLASSDGTSTALETQANLGFTLLITDASGATLVDLSDPDTADQEDMPDDAEPAGIQALFVPYDDEHATSTRRTCQFIGTMASMLSSCMQQGASQLTGMLGGMGGGGGGKYAQIAQMVLPILQQGAMQQGQMIGLMGEGLEPMCNEGLDNDYVRPNTIHISYGCASDDESTRGTTDIPVREVIEKEADIEASQGINSATYNLLEQDFCKCEGEHSVSSWVDTALQISDIPREDDQTTFSFDVEYDTSEYYCTMQGCGSPDEDEGIPSTWDEDGDNAMGGDCCGDDEDDDPDMGKNACLGCPNGKFSPEWDDDNDRIKPRTESRRDWSDEDVLTEDDQPNQCCGDDTSDCGLVIESEGKICASREVVAQGGGRARKVQFSWEGGIENWENIEEFGDEPEYADNGAILNVSCLGYPVLLAGEYVLGCNSESRIRVSSTEKKTLPSGKPVKTFTGKIMGKDKDNPFEFNKMQYLCHEAGGNFIIGACCSVGTCPSVSKGGEHYRTGDAVVQTIDGNDYTFYCTSNNNFTRDLDDESFGEETCEAAKNADGTTAGFTWTGSYCCGEPDDYLESYNDPPDMVTTVTTTGGVTTTTGGAQSPYDVFSGQGPLVTTTGAVNMGQIPANIGQEESIGACFRGVFQPNNQYLVEYYTGRARTHPGSVIYNGSIHGCAVDDQDAYNDGVNMGDNPRYQPEEQHNKPYDEGLRASNDWLMLHPDAPNGAPMYPFVIHDHPYCDRLGPDDDHKLFCSYNETWVFDESEEGRTHLSYIAWEPGEEETKRAECCQELQCWNGTACLEDFSSTPTAVGYGGTPEENYRCYDGEWVLSKRKYTHNGQFSGFCKRETDCLLNPEGEGTTEDPNCVESGFYTMDHYCDEGKWTTRTKQVAGALLSSMSRLNDYVLYCDTYENAFNFVEYVVQGGTVADYFAGEESITYAPLGGIDDTDDDPICSDNLGNQAPCANKVCVLTTGTKVVVGISTNAAFNSVGLNPLKLVGKNRYQCEAAISDDVDAFLPCGSDGTVWVHPEKQMIIASRERVHVGYSGDTISTLQQTLQDFLTIVMTFIDLNFMQFEGLDSAFVENTQDFSRLYIASHDTRRVYGIHEDNLWSAPMNEGGLPVSYLFVNYVNFYADPCPSLEIIRGTDTTSVCEQSSTGGAPSTHIISIQDAESEGGGFLPYWRQFTAGLR